MYFTYSKQHNTVALQFIVYQNFSADEWHVEMFLPVERHNYCTCVHNIMILYMDV